jgi:hypothetical protein
MSSVTISRCNVKHVFTQRYYGYIMMWRLYTQLFSMMFLTNTLQENLLKEFSNINAFQMAWHKCVCWGSFVFKTPYWLFLKPLQMFFSSVTYFNGEYEIVNNRLIAHQQHIQKKVVFRLFKIPFFMYLSVPNKKDWEERLLEGKNVVIVY